jgi:hypothetical protein
MRKCLEYRGNKSCKLFYIYVSTSKVKLSCYHHEGNKMERSYSSYSLLTLALGGGDEWSTSPLGCTFNPGKRTPGTHWIGGWVGLRPGLDTEARGKILCLCRGSNPVRPVCDQTPCCLSYANCSTFVHCF